MPKNNIASLGKSTSVICVEEVFDDSYHQPSSDGKLLQIYTLFIAFSKHIHAHTLIDLDHPIAFCKNENENENEHKSELKMIIIIVKATQSVLFTGVRLIIMMAVR